MLLITLRLNECCRAERNRKDPAELRAEVAKYMATEVSQENFPSRSISLSRRTAKADSHINNASA